MLVPMMRRVYGQRSHPGQMGRHHSAEHGGHPHMVRQHPNRHLTQQQRREWVALLLDTADELKMPDDPEFRSTLVGYLEWARGLPSSTRSPTHKWSTTREWGFPVADDTRLFEK